MTADEIIARLGLAPLEIEGGFFRETYRCDEGVGAPAMPARYGGPRCFGTAIYYLITRETHSRLHRLASDEIFHFLLGDPVT
ncbi:MAG: cupin domain-containing protein, partial [Planctomycetota bacterium]